MLLDVGISACGFRYGRLAITCSAWVVLTFLCLQQAPAAAPRTFIIGDSLSAEYDALPNIPGVEDPTAYAAVTVPGWESRSWVEVLGQLRGSQVNLGGYRSALPGWNDLRFTGYEYNFAIPGFTAAQYHDIVTSSIFYHPEYLTYRMTLSDYLIHNGDVCVVWIGGNELRANYGYLCNGGDPTTLVQDLSNNVAGILDFARQQSATVKIILVNLPDLGASPSKQAEVPDPAIRQRATQATSLANLALNQVAAARGVPVVDVFEATQTIIAGQPIWFGGVDIRLPSDPDNNPRYAFTRDGLHPNTGLQIEIAGRILTAMNQVTGAAIPPISDGEALALLGLNPQQPYLDWAAARQLPAGSGPGADPDADGLPNLAEFVFGLDPLIRNPSPVTFAPGLEGMEAVYQPVPDRTRLVNVTAFWSADLVNWASVPADRIVTAADGRVTIRFHAVDRMNFLRLQVSFRPVL